MSELEVTCVTVGALAIVGVMGYMQYEIEEMQFKLLCLEIKLKDEEERRRGVYD